MFSYHELFVLDPTMKTEGGWGSVQQGGSVQWYLTGANMFCCRKSKSPATNMPHIAAGLWEEEFKTERICL